MLAILSGVTVLSTPRREDIRYRAQLNLEDHLAKLRAGFEIRVRGGSFGQREHAIYDGLQATLGNKFHHREQLRFCAHVGAEERKLPTEKEPEVHLGVETGGGPAGHEPPGGREAREAFVPSSSANMFEDDVDAALPCNAAHFLANFLRFVIDEMVHAKLFALLQLRVAASSRNHARAEEFGNLNCGAPHPASRTEDEHIFAGLQLGAGNQHVPGRLKYQGDRSRFLKTQVFRIRHAIYFGDAHKFRATAVNQVAKISEVAAAIVLPGEARWTFAASNARREHHFLPYAHGCDIRANLRDFARNIASRNVRQRNRHAMDAETNPEIEMIQRAGFHPNKDLAGANDWVRHVFVFQYFRPAVLMKNNRLHESSGLSNRVRKVAFSQNGVQKRARIDSELAAPYAEVWAAAKDVMLKEAPRKMVFNLNNEASYDNGLICGGTLEVFVEPILPQPKLYLFGGGHVSMAVAKAASAAGFGISVVDDREAFANAERFPMAQEIYTGYEDAFQKIRPNASSYVVIVTRGHKEDMRVLAWAVRTEARYVGMIGSKRKVLSVYKALENQGYKADEFERVYAPMGLEIGALSPEEIAVSITAELVAVRRNAATAAHKKLKYEAHASPVLQTGER